MYKICMHIYVHTYVVSDKEMQEFLKMFLVLTTDLSLHIQDEEILNILEGLQGSASERIAEECAEQCILTGNFVKILSLT